MDLMLAGAHGVISVTANVAPKAMHEMCVAALAGDKATASEINDSLMALHQDLFVEANPIPVKWALYAMGLIGTGIRLPLTVLSDTYHEKIRAALKQANV
jgi:4-hydroxy-tetrahydrodipicolinate synthase